MVIWFHFHGLGYTYTCRLIIHVYTLCIIIICSVYSLSVCQCDIPYIIAMTMRSRQREIEWIDSQLERRQLEIQDLQNRMHEAEKLLVNSNLYIIVMLCYYALAAVYYV